MTDEDVKFSGKGDQWHECEYLQTDWKVYHRGEKSAMWMKKSVQGRKEKRVNRFSFLNKKLEML